VCANFKLTDYSSVCNFLVHPSIRKEHHETVATKIRTFLNDIYYADGDTEVKESIRKERDELYKTKPEIKPFDDIYACIRDMLLQSEIRVETVNSDSEKPINVEQGFNIVVGGNILGRGITFPNLQTVYYSRTAKDQHEVILLIPICLK
jgi:hypothetical protein